MNIMGVGGLELLVVAVVAMLVLGPTRVAQYGRTLGKLLGELRRASEGIPAVFENLIDERKGQTEAEEDEEDEDERSPGAPEGSLPQPRRQTPRRERPPQDSTPPEER